MIKEKSHGSFVLPLLLLLLLSTTLAAPTEVPTIFRLQDLPAKLNRRVFELITTNNHILPYIRVCKQWY